jgi:hypothetical protein
VMGVGTAWLGRPDYRTLAALTSSLGAKWGASVDRHQATPGHVQPRKPQVNATQSHVRPRPATGGVCMACKRSGVRVSVAPRFRRSEAIYADLDRLLIVQEVSLSDGLA